MDERVAQHDWWHVIELPGGEVTPGSWELRRTAAALPWPDLSGKRCLDVGTADGFWAFELERRGAAEVVAIDIPSAFQQRARARFELARELLGSQVAYEARSVYDVDGEFDVVVMGFMLQMVHDPIGALQAVHRACRGHLLLLDTVSLPLSLLPSPLVRLDARRDGVRVLRLQPARPAEGRRARGLDGRGADGDPARRARPARHPLVGPPGRHPGAVVVRLRASI